MDNDILTQTGKQKYLLFLDECHMGLFRNFQRRAPRETALRHCQHLGKGPVFFHCHIKNIPPDFKMSVWGSC